MISFTKIDKIVNLLSLERERELTYDEKSELTDWLNEDAGNQIWRFYDIRRWDLAQEIMKNSTPVPGMFYRDITTNERKEILVSIVSWNYKKKNADHTFPVPWNEYNMNPNLLPQNEGW